MQEETIYQQTERRVDVAFCADLRVEAPLHVAASSLLRHLAKNCTVVFHLLLSGFPEARKDLLRRTLDMVGHPYEVRFLPEIADRMFYGFRPLHGSLKPYYRLALPQVVEAQHLLYLDSDTVIQLDVSSLLGAAGDEYPAGFVEAGVLSDYPEREFFARVGLAADVAAFNSGVMLFHLSTWREEGWTERILEFCRANASDLSAADQTALNACFAGRFQRLDPKYNIALYTANPVPDLTAAEGIFHFVGSPKPWDPGGSLLHTAYGLYVRALRETAIGNHHVPYLDAELWRRMFKIKGGYYRSLRRRLSPGRRGFVL